SYHLGSNFVGKTVAQKRQSILQYRIISDCVESQIELKYAKYWEEAEFLIQFLNKERLQKVVYILAHSKSELHKDELLTTIIVLYEIDLFLDTGKTLFTHVISEVCNILATKTYKFQMNKAQLHELKLKYFNKVSRITREIIQFGVLPDSFNQYYYKRIHDMVLHHFPDLEIDNPRIFEIRGPGLFSKILLGYRIIQEMDEFSYALQSKEFTSDFLSPNDVKLLGRLFFKKHLLYQSQYKSSYLISLNIIKSVDSQFAMQIENKYNKQYLLKLTSCEIRNVYLRHKDFFRDFNYQFFLVKTAIFRERKKRGIKRHPLYKFFRTIDVPLISKMYSIYFSNNQIFNIFNEYSISLIDSFLEWDIKKRGRNK
ncbi:MAG: hypothetical protein HeimC3_41260, partial [Candidatus Heimdallarchaeota archaeon LC_3]